MQTGTCDTYRFGAFTLHRGRGELVGERGPIALRPKSFALLCHFVEHAGRLLSKDEIGRAVWRDVAVTDESIARCVSDVRTALGDQRQQLIRTMPGRGYLFAATVDRVTDDSPPRAAPDRGWRQPFIAVLPFVELCDDNRIKDLPQDYFARGVAEDLIIRLSKYPGLRVIARNSSFVYHGHVDESQVGHALGVRYLVVGSLRRAEDRLRLNVRLVDTTNGTQLWAERYDRRLGGVFDVQDAVTEQVAGMLIDRLMRAEIEAALLKPPERLDAYDLYLRGIAALRSAETAGVASGRLIVEARTLLQQSLAADPRHASALIRLSVTFMSTWGTRRHDPRVAGEHRQPAVIEQALRHAQQAAALDPSLADAWAQFGWCLHHSHRRDEAMQAYRRALELNASLADARYSLMLTHAGRHGEAIAFMGQVGQLDPFLRPFHASFLADSHYLLGDYEKALTLSRAAAERAPAFARIRIWQAAAAARLAQLDEARRAVEAVRRLDPRMTISRYLDHVRFSREEDSEHLAAGLRAAGLPG